MLVIIGSVAQNHILGSFPYNVERSAIRTPRDIDVVGSYDEVVAFAKTLGKFKSCYPINNGNTLIVKFEDGVIIEGSITWDNSLSAEFYNLVSSDPDTEITGFCRSKMLVPSLNVLYMLKMSHRFLKNSPAFKKTMQDIQLLRTQGAYIPELYREHYSRRQKEQYSYSHPKLNVTKEGFFNGDGVEYLHDHDSIHEAVKHLEQPAYMFFKPANSQVMVSKEMWDKLPKQVQLYSVLEEAYVLAAERSQLVFKDIPRLRSFEMALEKVCTSITSGWFRTFSWENYDTVHGMYNDDYMDRIYDGVASGIVKPYTGSKY